MSNFRAVSTGNISFNFLKNKEFKEFCHLLNSDYRVLSPDRLKRKMAENSATYVKITSDKIRKLDVSEDVRHPSKIHVFRDFSLLWMDGSQNTRVLEYMHLLCTQSVTIS